MEGVQNSDVATLSLLNGGYGGGYGLGGGHRGAGFEFDGSVINAKVDCNKETSLASHDALSQQISDNADRNRDLASSQSQNARDIAARDFLQGIGVAISQQVARGEDNQNQNFNQLTREAAANAREAAKCCCEAKVLAVSNQAKTDAGLATILANQDAATQVANAVANAMQNAKLDAILASNGRHG